MTDRLTYDLYRRTGQYGQRWWTIQGYGGGHRYALTETESKVLNIANQGKQKQFPPAGELPYADFDDRVIRAIGAIQQVAVWHRVCEKADLLEKRWDAEQKAAAQVARGHLADWLDHQWSGTWEDFKGDYKAALRNIPAPPVDQRAHLVPHGAEDNAQWKEQFMQEGT
jgi:broad specificity phosphatase PhoE